MGYVPASSTYVQTPDENPSAFRQVGGLQFGVVDAVVRASAIAMPKSLASITTVSGTAEMTSIGLPWVGFTGRITFIPTGAFTGATGGTTTASVGAVGKAFTAVAGKMLDLVFDGALWYPSYTS